MHPKKEERLLNRKGSGFVCKRYNCSPNFLNWTFDSFSRRDSARFAPLLKIVGATK